MTGDFVGFECDRRDVLSPVRAMFTLLRIETLDSWDQILYIAMFGCEGYPAGYPGLTADGAPTCSKDTAFGWFGAAVLFFLALFGASALPHSCF